MTSADAERERTDPDVRRLDGEANAALGATGPQHFATADRFHTGSKPVGALALDH